MLEDRVLQTTRVARAATAFGIVLWSAILLYPGTARSAPVTIEQPVKIDNVHDTLDVLVAGAQIVASLAALVALLFLARQVKGARDDNNAQRALSFQERFTSREFSRIVSPVLAYFRVTGASDCVAKIKGEMTAPHAEAPCLPRTPRDLNAPRPCLNDVSHVLGFFEDVGTAHGRKLVDRHVLLHSFGGNAVQVLMAAWWYIAWLRDNDLSGETKLFDEFQCLVKWLLEREKEFGVFDPAGASCILVLPNNGKHAGDGVWDVCAKLSDALTRCRGRRSERSVEHVRRQVAGVVDTLMPKVGVELFESVIIVPPGLDFEARPWKKERVSAEAIHDLITGLDARQARALALKLEQLPVPA
jgi:hypothetical protein